MEASGLRRIFTTLAVCLLAFAASPHAQPYQPSIACRVADTNMMLELYLPLAKDNSGNVARGMRGELQVNHPKMPVQRRRWNLDDKLPAQFWNVGNDLKFRLTPASGEDLVDLVVEVQRREQSAEAIGTFRLVTAEGVRVQGRIACRVD